MLINDFFFADPRDFDALLAEFVRQMRREQAQAILTVFFGASLVSHKLAEFGFWERPSTWKTMVYADQQALGPEGARLLDPQNWFLTRADIDTDD